MAAVKSYDCLEQILIATASALIISICVLIPIVVLLHHKVEQDQQYRSEIATLHYQISALKTDLACVTADATVRKHDYEVALAVCLRVPPEVVRGLLEDSLGRKAPAICPGTVMSQPVP